MKLIIDIGNTYTKTALFEDKTLNRSYSHKSNSKKLSNHIHELYQSHKIKSVIISSVLNYDKEIFVLDKTIPFIELTEKTNLPIINLYKTPETLGKDRIAAIIGAYALYPNTNNLVIDSGTCVTYDFINSKNEYLGGGISPGITLRTKALHQFTGKLPHIPIEKIDFLIGDTTKNSILSGVINGMVAEINGIIIEYEKHFNNINVILTGGNNIFFDRIIKNDIFVVSNILLSGLNEILDFNV